MTVKQLRAGDKGATTRRGEFTAHDRTVAAVSLTGDGQGHETSTEAQYFGAATGGSEAELYRTGDDLIRAVTEGVELHQRHPTGMTQTRAALKNSRGEAGDGVRKVMIDYRSAPGTRRQIKLGATEDTAHPDELDVVGPKDGRPLIVEIESGMPKLNIKSGNVIIIAGSTWGHSIHIGPDAHATVIARDGRKVHTSASGTATVDYFAEKNSRGFHSIDKDTSFTLLGEAEKHEVRD